MSTTSTFNVSVGPNTTTVQSNRTWVSYDLTSSWDTVCGIEMFIQFVGTFLNLWFLVAILRSHDLRSRLRNKIICNTFVLHLADSTVVIPAYSVLYIRHRFGQYSTCLVYSVIRTIELIHETITNWQLVMLIVVFIAQIQDLDLKNKLTPRIVQAGTWAILVIPWAVSLILVPSVSVSGYYCFFATYETRRILKILDTVLPIIQAVLLMLVAVFLRYIRFNRGKSRSMGTELISRGPEIDSSLPYIVAIVISTTCESMRLIQIINYKLFWSIDYLTSIRFYMIGLVLADSRSILMVLPWLFLPDIRERIKTWRPWYRPGPGIDLTVTYKKETI